MNPRLEELLDHLRQAMYEAFATSTEVAEAIAELEQEGHCPTLLVDVSLPSEPSEEEWPVGKGLVLTEYDQQFLRAIKVANPV